MVDSASASLLSLRVIGSKRGGDLVSVGEVAADWSILMDPYPVLSGAISRVT